MDDPYIALARASYTEYVTNGRQISPWHLGPAFLQTKAACFVTLYEHGDLRGCIGTLMPTKENLAEEIIHNAISACSRDPRFVPVTVEELPFITCSVDVLGVPEKVIVPSDLDPKKYGIIVSKDHRRGVLLPDLEGVDNIDTQIAIAKRKAGIHSKESVDIQRFTVVRYKNSY